MGLFAIKYLTSEKDAVEAFLVDYIQLLKLTDNLRKDKNLKKEQRENVERLLTSLRNARVFINTVALHSALEEAVAPYQPWPQKIEASAFEREFQKTKLYAKIKAMKKSSRLPKRQRTFLKKIDYEAKTFVKAETFILYCPNNIEDAEAKVLRARSAICDKFRVAKEHLHKTTDLLSLKRLSVVMDSRNWDEKIFVHEFDQFKNNCIENVLAKDKGQELFTYGLDLGSLEMELIQFLNIIWSKELLEPMQAVKHMYKQWQIVLRQKDAPVCETLRKLIKRAQRAPNSQAGCERSNS